MTCVICSPWKRAFTLAPLAPLTMISPQWHFFSNVSQGDDTYITRSITNCMKHCATHNIKKKNGYKGTLCSSIIQEENEDVQPLSYFY
jgi:hypothetical protein